MQWCEETIVRLFYNVSSSFFLLLFFFYYTSIFLAKVFHFLGGNPFLQRNQDGHDYDGFSEEGDEEEEEVEYFNVECKERDLDLDLVADIVHGGDGEEALLFFHTNKDQSFDEHTDEDEEVHTKKNQIFDEHTEEEEEVLETEETCSTSYDTASPPPYESQNCYKEEEVVVEEIEDGDTTDTDSDFYQDPVTAPVAMDSKRSGMPIEGNTHHEYYDGPNIMNQKVVERKFSSKDGKYLIFAPTQLEERKKLEEVKEKNNNELAAEEEEIYYGDSCTVGSTSKSSSEWRSSINCRDSATEDPFSSSSRRSCPKWESYAVFQKYDEEMLFLDRISAQKLHETESLRSIQACPKSISERIVHKLGNKNRKSSEFGHNPYHELEAAYVAQICLTWEALNWNYTYFQRLRASRRDSDPGCPAHVAQQFQQFQVLLQRYVENEPYEHGRRPEIYARMRSLAPKLLQVPQYRDSDDEQKEESFRTRIPSASFLEIMEESIRTFMSFLKQDKETHCQILVAFFRRNRRGSVDPTHLLLLKKVNNKKKIKLKDLRRVRKCIRKRKLTEEMEMAILMGLIDLKVVSRVLRMSELSVEQLQWSEDKMGKVKVSDGKLQRDSLPLFFPAH